jgi:SAM-dependent methyltransferase
VTATPVYEPDVSEIYDFFYRGRGQDFAAEAGAVADVVQELLPEADSVLDVGCGTGEHLRLLADRFRHAVGLELSASMCDVARAKDPRLVIHRGDMREFDLGRTFAAVCSLTSTVGYMSDVDELALALHAMARHLAPGGVLVVDPYWSPERFLDGHIAHDVVRDGGRTVLRLSHSVRTGRAVRHEAHYLAADPSGIRHFTHVQPLHLFTEAEYLAAFQRAGCPGEHRADAAYPDRGLFVGVRR